MLISYGLKKRETEKGGGKGVDVKEIQRSCCHFRIRQSHFYKTVVILKRSPKQLSAEDKVIVFNNS